MKPIIIVLGVVVTGLVRAGGAPLCAEERDALAFLEYVTGSLPVAAENDWWNIGGTQHGIFAKRYNIAFAGYAAAAIGMRGDAETTNRVGRILGNCVERFLQRDVWAYSQSKSYWGQKPWAPDPCYRENVMYTGHLLQLLALYEWFTHDRRYWDVGFDFVWNPERKVHYTVQRLIDVIVEQIRANASGGVTCEPGLLFFPCNNHPHYALKLFARLGHGDWSADTAKWEKWSLAHYPEPAAGGGALKLLYHVQSGLFYPRGTPGIDGWSMLWYEAWASDRANALKLWKSAAAHIEWGTIANLSDTVAGNSCCDPQPVSASVAAAFLCAAARACDDPATAERLEKPLDAKYLVRRTGRYYLDLDRQWRIGASAQRIIALAIAHGSSFRALA
ncbi:MAG: hypothetical protein J6334_13655, partial [Kiritimatiellae bacterium]|nr:hypothetical protein [Kiritimatiellia bacterium]